MAIRATNVELLLVGRPGNGGASDLALVVVDILIGWDFLWLDGHEWLTSLVHDVPDLDVLLSGGSDELVLEVESQGVDLTLGLVLNVRLAQVVVVPNLDAVVLSTGDDVLAVEGESQGVDVVLVGSDGGDALEVSGPDLESAVSADGSVVLVLLGGRVSDLGDPLSVVVFVVGLTLHLGLDVPQSEALLVTGRVDLAVVSGEAHGLDFLLVLDELSGALGVSQIPESQSSVPRRGDDVDVVVGDVQIGDEVVVTSQASLWLTEVALSVLLVQVPDDQGLVTGSRDQDGVFVLVAGGVTSDDGGDGITVTEQESGELEVVKVLAFHFNWRIY